MPRAPPKTKRKIFSYSSWAFSFTWTMPRWRTSRRASRSSTSSSSFSPDWKWTTWEGSTRNSPTSRHAAERGTLSDATTFPLSLTKSLTSEFFCAWGMHKQETYRAMLRFSKGKAHIKKAKKQSWNGWKSQFWAKVAMEIHSKMAEISQKCKILIPKYLNPKSYNTFSPIIQFAYR